MKIGFIGLGAMGLPMFRNLSKKYPDAVAYDLSPETRQAAAQEGLPLVETPQEIVGRDIIITMLPHGAAVRASLFGGADSRPMLPQGLNPGGTIIDMSSSSPVDTKELSEQVQREGFNLVDAPVSGSVPKASNATLSIMLGADDSLAARVTPILECVGSTIIRTGAVGTAHAMKTLNNYVYAAGLMAASEALIMGKALGLNLTTLVDVLNCSSGRNVATETKLKQHMLEGGDFRGGFGLHLMAKDLGITHSLHEHLGFLPEQLDLCHRTWQAASRQLEAGADNLEIAVFLEERLTRTPSSAA